MSGLQFVGIEVVILGVAFPIDNGTFVVKPQIKNRFLRKKT